MKRYACLYLMLMLIGANCFAAAKPVVKSKPKLTPKKPIIAALKPVTPASRSDILMLSPSIRDGAQLYAGWPLILNLSMWRQLPEDSKSPGSKPIIINAISGAWCEALVVTIKGSSGAAIKLPLHLVKQEGAELSLGVNDMAEVTWWLAPEETKGLAEGAYNISIGFDPKLLTDSINQKADNYYLSVMKEPSPLEKETQESKDLALASFSILRGDLSAASVIVSKVLASNPECIGGHRLNGRLLAVSGKLEEALSSLDTAWDIYDKKYPDACPPRGLLAERSEIQAKMKPDKLPVRK
jgi:hypothetical protein